MQRLQVLDNRYKNKEIISLHPATDTVAERIYTHLW